MSHKILAISGSPVKEGNVQNYLRRMLEHVNEDDFTSELISLMAYDIKECRHCNFCLSKQTPEKFCSIKDDMAEILNKIEMADIIVLGSPVYFMRTSAKMAAFIDRLRVFVFGNLTKGKLKNKIGVSVAVSWLRNGGVETTHLSHLYAFLTLEMIPVSSHNGISPLGASALASENGSGKFDPSVRLGIEKDEDGLYSADQIMKRAIELTRLINK